MTNQNTKQYRIKIYLSGSITGFTKDHYTKRFQRAEDLVLEHFKYKFIKVAIINPVKKSYNVEDGFDYNDAICIDFACIQVADAIVMLPYWENSIGANREKHYALAYEKPVLYIQRSWRKIVCDNTNKNMFDNLVLRDKNEKC
jgi:hypothetical protein